jgi:hypothetical protein
MVRSRRKAPPDIEGIETRVPAVERMALLLEPSQSPARHRGHRNAPPLAELVVDLPVEKPLTGILNAICTFPPCRRPHQQCDYEHSQPYDRGGRTCLCQAGPVCRASHRAKQSPGWHLEQAGARGWFRWTTPSGRSYLSRPTQYPD